MTRALLLLLAAGALATVDVPADESKKELERMQGDWAADSYVSDGMKVPDDDAQALFRTIKGDAYTVFRFRKVAGQGTMKLDASKKPKAIDAFPAGSTGKPLLGIYEIDGDRLKLCFAGPGKDRPTAFTSEAGSGHTLSVWVREKKQ
jgi:uncharacterized protein (TIGR03067 family)